VYLAIVPQGSRRYAKRESAFRKETNLECGVYLNHIRFQGCTYEVLVVWSTDRARSGVQACATDDRIERSTPLAQRAQQELTPSISPSQAVRCRPTSYALRFMFHLWSRETQLIADENIIKKVALSRLTLDHFLPDGNRHLVREADRRIWPALGVQQAATAAGKETQVTQGSLKSAPA
jgi:hypothetical protein